ncbi:MAG TPA: PDZ domain-containing protein [Gemmataceae bacterium]|nr:PDZ domain-containing protein [Gemmataceae bacterium]
MKRCMFLLVSVAVLLSPAAVLGAPPPQLNIRTAETNQELKVTAVAADGLGKQMGLKENDVLVSVNGTKTATSKDLREALARVNKDVEIVLLRGGARQTVKGTLKSSSRGEGRYVFMPEKR